jgi:hypothetical protein
MKIQTIAKRKKDTEDGNNEIWLKSIEIMKGKKKLQQ